MRRCFNVKNTNKFEEFKLKRYNLEALTNNNLLNSDLRTKTIDKFSK